MALDIIGFNMFFSPLACFNVCHVVCVAVGMDSSNSCYPTGFIAARLSACLNNDNLTFAKYNPIFFTLCCCFFLSLEFGRNACFVLLLFSIKFSGGGGYGGSTVCCECIAITAITAVTAITAIAATTAITTITAITAITAIVFFNVIDVFLANHFRGGVLGGASRSDVVTVTCPGLRHTACCSNSSFMASTDFDQAEFTCMQP